MLLTCLIHVEAAKECLKFSHSASAFQLCFVLIFCYLAEVIFT